MTGRVLARLVVLGWVAFGGGWAGCASRALPPPPEPDLMDLEDYVIGPSDQLQIIVWKNPELSGNALVRTDGKISLPLLDDVQAAGLTPMELKEVLTEALREFVTNPDITVNVTAMNSHQVFVLGEVGRQGPLPLSRHLRILDALASAGGFGAFADKNDVRILRRTPQGIVEYHFDYDAYLDGEAPETNMLLQSGDTIVVPE